jgi:hypothetical protein
MRSVERQAYTTREQFASRGHKAVRAQSMRGRMAMLGPVTRTAACMSPQLDLDIWAFRVHHKGDYAGVWHQFAQELQPLCPQVSGKIRYPRDIAARPVEAGDKTEFDRVAAADEDNRDR